MYSKTFDWRIAIPAGFEHISAEEWGRLQDKGADAIGKTLDATITERPRTIFVFRNNALNCFEANYQPFDTLTDGDYDASCKTVADAMYQTFAGQLEGLKMDTTFSFEKIDGLRFNVFRMQVQYPNNIKLQVAMYSRLFGKKEFSVNIIYADAEKGAAMLQAWRESHFGNNPTVE